MTTFARGLIHTAVGCEPASDECDRIRDLLSQVEDDRAHKEAQRLRERAAEIHEGAVDKYGEVYGTLRFAAKTLRDEAERIDPYMEREGLLVRKRDDKVMRPVKDAAEEGDTT